MALNISPTNKKLAKAVYGAEEQGATVQVFKCVPVKHEVQIERVGIEFYEEKYL